LVPGLLILKAEVAAGLVRLPSTAYFRLALEEAVGVLAIAVEPQAVATPGAAQAVQVVMLAVVVQRAIQVMVVTEVIAARLLVLVLVVGQAAAVLTLAAALVF
jgi:hypothetical protein